MAAASYSLTRILGGGFDGGVGVENRYHDRGLEKARQLEKESVRTSGVVSDDHVLLLPHPAR